MADPSSVGPAADQDQQDARPDQGGADCQGGERRRVFKVKKSIYLGLKKVFFFQIKRVFGVKKIIILPLKIIEADESELSWHSHTHSLSGPALL